MAVYGYLRISGDDRGNASDRDAILAYARGLGLGPVEFPEADAPDTAGCAISASAESEGSATSHAIPAHQAAGQKAGHDSTPSPAAARKWRTIRLAWLVEEKCAPGDSILVPGVSRLGRSIQQVYGIVSVCRARDITLHLVGNGIVVRPEKGGAASAPGMAAPGGSAPPAMTAPPAGPTEILASTFGIFAEFEREIMLAASKEAVGAWKRGVGKSGRP